MKQNGLVGEIDFDKNIASLWFDLAGSPSDETVQALLTLTTSDHLLYGSDYPYIAPQVIKNNMERMKSYLGMRSSSPAFNAKSADEDVHAPSGLIIRIAEIEVYKKYLEEYLTAAHDVGTTSVEQEPGVICIFPMQVKDKPTTIRIVEIYRDEAAYQSHLQTPHFLTYKQGTLHMVRKFRLVPVDALAPEAMPLIFEKIK